MKNLLLTCFIPLLLSSISLSAQTGLQWQRPIGGTNTDTGSEIFKTIDGEIITVGQTSSNNGDISGNHGQSDILVIKMTTDGIIKWKKCFGGSKTETLRKSFYNPDGSILIFSQTNSSEGDILGFHDSTDVWVLKLDGDGNILWQKTFGGSGNEDYRGGAVLNDNSMVMSLISTSNDGDISGNHGMNDFCIVKLSSSGNLVWQKCFGGTDQESTRGMIAMPDGNFIILGGTQSNNGDITNQKGISDVWIIKISNAGSLLWQKTYGGSLFDRGLQGINTSDGNIIVAATSESNNGDVIGQHGRADNWILKINYADASIIWQNSIGGGGTETPAGIIENQDNTLLITSITASYDGDAITNHSIYYDDILASKLTSAGVTIWNKCFGGFYNENLWNVYNDTASQSYLMIASTVSSDGDITGYHHGPQMYDTLSDAWLFRMDYNGNIIWKKCLGGDNSDYLFSVAQIQSNEYLLYGETKSNNGDVQHNNGDMDAWLVKFGSINTIKGTVFFDNNLNGIKDVGENYVNNILVKSSKGSTEISSLSTNGMFLNETDTGTYITTPYSNNPYYTFVPTSRTQTFTTYFNTDSTSFALQPIPGKKDLQITLLPITAARPGFAGTYKIVYKNLGTDIISGTIDFIKDPRQSFVSSLPAFTFSNADTFRLNYTNLNPLDSSSILIQVQNAIPPTLTITDTLHLKAIVPVTGDLTPANNTSILIQRANGSLDPNDKTEIHGGSMTPLQVASSEYLNYIIRFQNTGTDTAFTVSVKDTLDNKLDWNSIQMISASHPYTVSITNGNNIEWDFNNINLPDSNRNEPASHGYLAFQIKPKTTLVSGDTIKNNASIYFDFNPSVQTNTQKTIVDPSVALPIKLINFEGNYQNGIVNMLWRTSSEYNFSTFQIERSKDALEFKKLGDVKASGSLYGSLYTFRDNNPNNGYNYYRLKIIDNNGKFTYSNIVVINLSANNIIPVQLSPNPADNILFIKVRGLNEQTIIQIIDATGRKIKEFKILLNGSSLPLEIKDLPAGSYTLLIRSSSKTLQQKFIKK